MSRRPPLIVVLDPLDLAATSWRVLDAHNPERGSVSVHPTPGAHSRVALAHDILIALGTDAQRLGQLRPAVTTPRAAAYAWLTERQIRQIAVLRTHLFSFDQWNVLLEMRRHVDAAVIAICHEPTLPRLAARMLRRVEHTVVSCLEEAAEPLARFLADAPPRTLPPPRIRALAPVSHSQVEHFRADAARMLAAAHFADIDAEYRVGLIAACGWIREQSRLTPESGFEGEPMRCAVGDSLASFLTELIADTGGRQASVARLRGAEAGFLLHGLQLALPVTPGPASGPGFTNTPIDQRCLAVLRERLAHPLHAAALAAALFTGVDPLWLRRVRLNDLSPDAAQLTLRWPHGACELYAVPPAVRPLLRAARFFMYFSKADYEQNLLDGGIGPGARVLRHAADRCGLTLPHVAPRAPGSAWHHAAECWRVADPIHGPWGVGDLARFYGAYIRALRMASGSDGAERRAHPQDTPLTADEAACLMALTRRSMLAPAVSFTQVSDALSALARRGAVELLTGHGHDGQDHLAVPDDDLLFALDLRVRGEPDGCELATLRARAEAARSRVRTAHSAHAVLARYRRPMFGLSP